MSTEPGQPPSEPAAKKAPAVRPWFLVLVLGWAALVAWVAWPSDSDISPAELSRVDGKSRFCVTAYRKLELPASVPLHQRLYLKWAQIKRRHLTRNPAARSFPATPLVSCSVYGLLDQCMELTGTQYLIAVESLGAVVEFGHTNALNGAEWVVAFEHAVGTSGPVPCYDYSKKLPFEDTLLLIREEPRVVKVVPRSKLAEYQKAGLVKAGSR